jgi:hypothetical protein
MGQIYGMSASLMAISQFANFRSTLAMGLLPRLVSFIWLGTEVNFKNSLAAASTVLTRQSGLVY